VKVETLNRLIISKSELMQGQNKVHFHSKVNFFNDLFKNKYCADLYFNLNENSNIEIRLFMDLDAKSNYFRNEIVGKVLGEILIIEDISSQDFIDIDFSNSKVVKTRIEFGKKYFQIFVDQFTYKLKRNGKDMPLKSAFYLVSDAQLAIGRTDLSSFNPLGKWEMVRNSNWRSYLGMKYVLTNEYYKTSDFGMTSNEMIVNRIPLLSIQYKSKEAQKALLRANLMCIFLSFYLCRHIEWYLAIEDSKDFKKITLKNIDKTSSGNRTKPRTTSFHDVEEFIQKINAKKEVENHYDFWFNVIDKFVLASSLKGESKFMILYNILELSVVHLKSRGKIKAHYKNPVFKGLDVQKIKVNKLCTQLILDIEELIPKTSRKDRLDFKKQNKNIGFKNAIINKKTEESSSYKIQLLIRKLKIDVTKVGNIDSKAIVSVRNLIIHPSVKDSIENVNLKDLNQKLFSLVNLVLLKQLNQNYELK